MDCGDPLGVLYLGLLSDKQDQLPESVSHAHIAGIGDHGLCRQQAWIQTHGTIKDLMSIHT